MSARERAGAGPRRVLVGLVLAASAGCTTPTQPRAPREDRFACSHAYLPMGEAVRREYRVNARDPGIEPFHYAQSYAPDDGGAAPDGGFTETLAFSNGARRLQHLRCEPGGGWRVLDTSVEGLSSQAPGAAIATRGVVTLPAAEDWRAGASWSDAGELSGSDLPGLPPALRAGAGATLSGTVTVASTIAAREAVEVPAGRFDSFRVDAVTTQRVVVDTGVLGKLPVELSTTTRTWYARGVGMVRQVAEPYGLTTELVAARTDGVPAVRGR